MTLDRFREITLADAQAAADALLAEARTAADARRASCEADAAQLAEQSRTEGREAASRELVGEERMAQRHARELLLHARRALYERTRSAAIEDLLRRRDSEEYRHLLAALKRRAADQLGAGVASSEGPADQGGIVGQSGGRRVTYAVADLVDDELARRSTEIERLWT